MAAIDTASDFVADEESFSSSAYWDVNGYAIGYGNHYYADGSSVKAGDTISRADALDLMNGVLQDQIDAITAQLDVTLNTNQLAALASIRYNAGTITTSLLNLINSGAPDDQVADQIRTTLVTSRGVVNPVLIARRAREADLYLSSPGLAPVAIGIAIAIAIYYFAR